MIARALKLRSVWRTVRSRPAWLSVMSASLRLSPGEEAYLSELEDGYRAGMRELESAWRRGVHGRASGLRDEIANGAPEWAKDRRREYLEARLKALDAEKEDLLRAAIGAALKGWNADLLFLTSLLQDAEKSAEGVARQLRALWSGGGNGRRLTDAQIQRAKDCPLESVLPEEPVRGRILCPIHEERTGHRDSHPSMLVKGGFGYCFSCAGRLDALGYMMKVNGLTFRAAVEALQ